jgi:DIS3-like exonuclease 2
MLMTPMKPAEYMAAGGMEPEEWRHFALNIPYYTHFTSPIRRYPDVIVHRLLQATIDGEEAIETFPMDESEVQVVSIHCNEKRMASKKAQDRSDRVFLALYLRKKPLKAQLGVVLSVGEKTFTVFVPSLGASIMLFLDEHKEQLTFEPYTKGEDERRIRLVRKAAASAANGNTGWSSIDVKVFTKLSVSCHCKEKPPIDVKVKLEGPWTHNRS